MEIRGLHFNNLITLHYHPVLASSREVKKIGKSN